ncbi:MAG: PepSY domain-containing protein [Firmicutes bacterium]|nr:PepSY domain-containing protein [Bacillota bacterium]
MKKRLVTFVLSGLLAFSTTGMVFAETEAVANPVTPDPPLVAEEPQSGVLTIGAAIEIALAAVPQGSVVSIKLGKQHAVKVYQIQVKTGAVMHMVKIDALTGDVLKLESENEPETADPVTDPVTDPATDPITDPTTAEPAVVLPAISFENAVQIALDSVSNGAFVSIRLGADNDVMVYKVIIQTGKKANPIKIDATTGDILKAANDKHAKKPVIEKTKDKTIDQSNQAPAKPKGNSKK